MGGLGSKRRQIQDNWLVPSGCDLLRKSCPGLWAAAVGQTGALCSVALSISVVLVILMAPVVSRWVLELGCPEGMSAPPTAARHGSQMVHPVWTRHLCGRQGPGARWVLRSRRHVGELVPSELESNQPQPKHPAKLWGGISAMARSISRSISLLCSRRSESLLTSWHPVSGTKLGRMTFHPQQCSTTSLGQGHMEEGCSSFLRTLLSSHNFALSSFHGNTLAHSPPVTGQRRVCARSESCCQNEPKDKHFKAS